MGILSGIFKGKKAPLPPIDLADILVDMHSHLIPGIDDGSKSMDETIAMLAKFESLGYKKIITTPHVMSDYFRNTPEIILSGLEEVRATAKQLNLTIQIEAAAEYYYDESLMDRLRNKEQLLTFGDNYILFEFSFHSEPSYLDELFFQFITQGYQPILAHVERYAYLFGDLERPKMWREKGINLQLNLNSLSGHYGSEVQKQAQNLVDAGLIDFVGSDCHRIEHLMTIEASRVLPYYHRILSLPLKNKELLQS